MDLQLLISLQLEQSETVPYDKFYSLNNLYCIQTADLIKIISTLLKEMIKEIQKTQEFFFKTAFDGKEQPIISLFDYLNRISTYSVCSQESLILAIIYIDVLTQKNQFISLNSYNIHRIVATALVIAIKYFDEQYYENAYYSKLAGISNKELNTLEIQFLNLIDYTLYISPEKFFTYRQKIISFASSTIDQVQVSDSQVLEKK